MTFTDDDKAVLKSLVEAELAHIKKDEKNFSIVNSPVLSGVYRMKETDIPFLKSAKMYEKFLEDLLQKL
jgi:hypothetical protein